MEPTEEQVKAFKQAWEAEDARTDRVDVEYRPGDRTRAGLRAVFATFPEDEGFTVIDGDKDVETGQPAYDDHMTRQLLVQVLPHAPLSELEAKRAWIAGEAGAGVDVREAVREALADLDRTSAASVQEMHTTLRKIAEIVGFRA